MLLGFKERFAPFVQEGSKTHTIRARRRTRPIPGETCHCYYALRTKQCRLLGRFECVKVQEIEIRALTVVVIDGILLHFDERNALAWADGFRGSGRDGAFQEMFEYWTKLNHELPFSGDIIHWKYQAGTDGR